MEKIDLENIIFLFMTTNCTIYIYSKIANVKLRVKIYILLLSLSAILTLAVYLTGIINSDLRYAAILLVVVVSMKFVGNTGFGMATVCTLLSFAMCNGTFLVAAAISFAVMRVILSVSNPLAIMLITLIIQAIIIFFIFRYPRLKHGFSFLQNKWWSYGAGLVISGIVLLAILIIRNESTGDTLAAEFFIAAIIASAMIILWGLVNLTTLYRVRQYEKNAAQDRETIAELTRSNETLSKQNHSDNKLVSAMLATTVNFLSEAGEELTETRKARMYELLSGLRETARHRERVLMSDKKPNDDLPQTGIYLVDILLNYMQQKAATQGIEFTVSVKDKIQDENICGLSHSMLENLLADLIENVFFAVKACSVRRAAVDISSEQNIMSITVSDNGTPFRIDILHRLGTERVTTRADVGGSGIGFMTIFEILREVDASLIISECENDTEWYTKSITVRFDSAGEYIVETHRANELRASSNRVGMIIETLSV